MQWDRDTISRRRSEIIARYGEWWDNFELRPGIWTGKPGASPNPLLIRILQIVEDISRKPLSESTVLDLACGNGHFSIEFALRGASVVAVEGRQANIEKARFAKDVLGLENLTLLQEDVRAVSKERLGTFDIVLCSGILYHLRGESQGPFIENLYDMSGQMVIFDTHVGLSHEHSIQHRGFAYYGTRYREHWRRDSEETIARRCRASLDNESSFWLTRPSLVNLLRRSGFSSIYECFDPPFKGADDRCTFVAIKETPITVRTFSKTSRSDPGWDEHELSYPISSGITKGLRCRLEEWLDRPVSFARLLALMKTLGRK